VQPLVHQHGEICAPWSIGKSGCRHFDIRDVLSQDRERESGGVVTHHVDGPLGVIEAGPVTVEVDERDVLGHCPTKTCIVRMARVRASVSVVDALVRRLILIWPFFAWDLRHRCDAEREFTDSGLEDPLGPNEWNATPAKVESLLQDPSWEDRAAVQGRLLLEEVESGHPHGTVEVGSHWGRILCRSGCPGCRLKGLGSRRSGAEASFLWWTQPQATASCSKV
jgi:hypothetical protein